MKLRNIVLILLATMMLTTFNVNLANSGPIEPPGGTFEKYGPRVNDLIFNVAGTISKEAEMLELGDIDVMDWAAPSSKLDLGLPDNWFDNPDIALGNYSEFGWYEYDLNLQMWPIGHGVMDGVTGPPPPAAADWSFPATWDPGHLEIDYGCQRCLDSREFRRALAHLTNRAAIESQFYPTIDPMQTFVFPAISDWENPAAPKYARSLSTAGTVLYNAGFRDYDGDHRLEYSKDRTLANKEELPDLQLWIRKDDEARTYAGQLLWDDLVLLEVGVDGYITSRSECYYHAWNAYDYSIYTGGWGWGRVPDSYFECWHSSKDSYPFPSADNYNRYHSAEYDAAAMAFKTAATVSEAKTQIFQCQMILHRDVACIPLYTMKGFVGHRVNYGTHTGEEKYEDLPWEGFVNERGYAFYGANIGFSALNAHPQGFEKGGTLRHGLVVDVVKFDCIDAEWFYDWLVLYKVYEPAIVYHPSDVTQYIPWLCDSYSVGEWGSPTKTKVTLNLLPNILWHDGEVLKPIDVGFTWQYLSDALSVPFIASVANFDHYELIEGNSTAVILYFDVQSWLALEWLSTVPVVPWHIFKDIPATLPGDPTPGGSWAYDPEVHDTVIGTGPFRFYKDGVVGRVNRVPGQFVFLERNPNYHRRFTWPDVCNSSHAIDPGTGKPYFDSWVDLDDFMEVAKPANMFKEENYDGTWPIPPGNAWGEACDVNKDGRISVGDLMAIGVRLADPWPPPWY